MSLTHGPLLDIQNVGDPVGVAQTNFELLSRDLYKLTPTYQSGAATTIIGPPTSGNRALDELWTDALGAVWRCTIAGDPGTWRQEKAAVVATPPSTGTIPTGYEIRDAADKFRSKYHAGAYSWVSTFNCAGHGIAGKTVAKTGAYSATIDDYFIACNTTSAGFTVTLPAPSTVPGSVFVVKKTSADGNTLTLASASGTIDGAANKTTTTQYAGWIVISDGTNYHLLP